MTTVQVICPWKHTFPSIDLWSIRQFHLTRSSKRVLSAVSRALFLMESTCQTGASSFRIQSHGPGYRRSRSWNRKTTSSFLAMWMGKGTSTIHSYRGNHVSWLGGRRGFYTDAIGLTSLVHSISQVLDPDSDSLTGATMALGQKLRTILESGYPVLIRLRLAYPSGQTTEDIDSSWKALANLINRYVVMLFVLNDLFTSP